MLAILIMNLLTLIMQVKIADEATRRSKRKEEQSKRRRKKNRKRERKKIKRIIKIKRRANLRYY